jgi:drug/metabolite transporter (DMT)-like permease
VVFCINIVLGNISLKFVPVSFMQTVKSSVPFFTVVLERFVLGTAQDKMIYASVAPIVGGVSLASWGEQQFEFTGFMAALVASVVTAWLALLTAKLLQTKLDAVNLLYYMTPLSAIFLLPFALYLEIGGIMADLAVRQAPFFLFFTLFLSGAIAFSLNCLTFLLINSTSALTYTVLGNVKVIFSITISVMIFRNPVGFMNAIGCIITLAGAAWYQNIKRSQAQAANQAASLPVPARSPSPALNGKL